MAEWLKAPDSKSDVRASVPEVRILSLPPVFTFSSKINVFERFYWRISFATVCNMCAINLIKHYGAIWFWPLFSAVAPLAHCPCSSHVRQPLTVRLAGGPRVKRGGWFWRVWWFHPAGHRAACPGPARRSLAGDWRAGSAVNVQSIQPADWRGLRQAATAGNLDVHGLPFSERPAVAG